MSDFQNTFDEKFEKALAATGRPQDYRPRGRYGVAGMKRYAAHATGSKVPGALFVADMLSRKSPSKVAEEISVFLESKGLSHKFFAGAAKKTVRFSVNQGSADHPHWVGLTKAQARGDLAEIGIVV
jgi:hypothetical protein